MGFSTGLFMLGIAIILGGYMFLSSRSRFLPHLPLGWLIAYFATYAIHRFVGHVPFVVQYEKWIGVGYTVLLSWAVVRLSFALFVELPLRKWRKIEIPNITRDFILLMCYAILFFVVLRTRGDVDLAGLITTSAALTVVVGLAAQTTLGNFFSGLVLQMEHPFGIGDWITYESHIGRVVGITWKSTRIVTRDNVLIYLPNNELSNRILVNYSKPDKRMVGRINIGLEYDAPPSKVREVILGVLDKHSKVLQSPRPQVRLISFDDSSINYEIRFWYNSYLLLPQIKAAINEQLWYALRRNGITIPFPIRDTQHAHIERRHKRETRKRLSDKIQQMLEGVPLLEALCDEERKTISGKASVQEYGDGEIIVRQDDPGDSLYVILDGSCDVLLEQSDGTSKKVAAIGTGDFFGELSLLTGEKRSATVKAQPFANVVRVDKALFSTLLASNPDICETLGEVMAQRQKDLSQKANQAAGELANSVTLISRIKTFFKI